MVSDRKEKARTVRFVSEADQLLLEAIEQKLAEQAIGFSEFCKQALQQVLQPPDSVAEPPSVWQQQILDLQVQVARIEGKEEARQRYALRRLEQQMRELGDRLASLERKEYLEQQVRQLTDRLMRLEVQENGTENQADGAIASPDLEASALDGDDLGDDLEEAAIDPLLNRLAPLLEDF
jgi:TolA-binding protein